MVEVLYEDHHLLVLNKPVGLLTQDSGTGKENLEEQAREWIKKKKQKTGNVFLHAVHRLDRLTSGIVLFALSSKALSRLKESLRKNLFQKTYLALVEGEPDLEQTLTDYLFYYHHRSQVVSRDTPDAKRSVLHVRSSEKKGNQTLLTIELETGRTHQIRSQLSHRGYPIVGDQMYGSTQEFSSGGIALHHARFVFPHPVGGKEMKIESNPEWAL